MYRKLSDTLEMAEQQLASLASLARFDQATFLLLQLVRSDTLYLWTRCSKVKSHALRYCAFWMGILATLQVLIGIYS